MKKITPDCSFYFTAYKIDVNRTIRLVLLLAECERLGVEIKEVGMMQNGYVVTFKGHENADAILHDNSFRNETNEWETMGFPWDNDDVSTHDAKTLARLIYRLNHKLAL